MTTATKTPAKTPAACVRCDRPMDGAGCDEDASTLRHDGGEPCSRCDAPAGGYHHPPCDAAACAEHGGQRYGCPGGHG